MSETALYRSPGDQDIWGHKLAAINCPDGEVEARIAEGWHTDPNAAAAAGKPTGPVVEAEGANDGGQEAQQEADAREGRQEVLNEAGGDDSPPTRAELEEKAQSLGIGFNARTKDETLAAKIEAKLKA